MTAPGNSERIASLSGPSPMNVYGLTRDAS
jgi:hypothetical protein